MSDCFWFNGNFLRRKSAGLLARRELRAVAGVWVLAARERGGEEHSRSCCARPGAHEPGDPGAHGIFDEQAHARSPQLWLTMHKRSLLGGAAIAGLAATLAVMRAP